MTHSDHLRLCAKAYRLSLDNGGYCPSEAEQADTGIYEGQSSEEIADSMCVLIDGIYSPRKNSINF